MFMCEKQIFNNGFFETSKKLIEILITKYPEALSVDN